MYLTIKDFLGVSTAFITLGLGALGFCIKHWISNIDKKMDQFAATQSQCRQELPEKYVLKHECEKDMAINSAAILKVAGKLNGGSLHHDVRK